MFASHPLQVQRRVCASMFDAFKSACSPSSSPMHAANQPEYGEDGIFKRKLRAASTQRSLTWLECMSLASMTTAASSPAASCAAASVAVQWQGDSCPGVTSNWKGLPARCSPSNELVTAKEYLPILDAQYLQAKHMSTQKHLSLCNAAGHADLAVSILGRPSGCVSTGIRTFDAGKGVSQRLHEHMG